MITTSKHPFLTFVVSGFVAFVLIGGGLATLSAINTPQDISSQAYMRKPIMTAVPYVPMSPMPSNQPRVSPQSTVKPTLRPVASPLMMHRAY